MAHHYDPLDDITPPRLCPTCARPVEVAPLAEDSIVVALVCPVHGLIGTLDARDVLDEE